MNVDHPIVFYDGDCGFCHHSVQTIRRLDRHARIFYAPLQGDTARSILTDDQIRNLDTLYFYDNGRLFNRSAAVIRIAKRIGGIYSMAVLFLVIPRFLRDAVYDRIAANRHAMSDHCEIPTERDRKFFLP